MQDHALHRLFYTFIRPPNESQHLFGKKQVGLNGKYITSIQPTQQLMKMLGAGAKVGLEIR